MTHLHHAPDLERAHGVTWRELVELEPKLGELLWAARQTGATCHNWSDVKGLFTPFQNALVGLVGPSERHLRHPVLASAGAYEVVYWRLYDAITKSFRARPPRDRRSPQRTETRLDP